MHALLPRRAQAVGIRHDGRLVKQHGDVPEREQQQRREHFRHVQLPQRAADVLDARRRREQERRHEAEDALHHQRQH